MSENQSQNKTSLLQKEIPADVRHADEQGRGQCKRNCKLAQPRSLVGIEGISLAGNIAECEDKKYWEQRSY